MKQEPAYPTEISGDSDYGIVWAGDDNIAHFPGLTKRERYAMAAMQGDWAAQNSDDTGVFHKGISDSTLRDQADLYFRMADAMIRVSKENEIE